MRLNWITSFALLCLLILAGCGKDKDQRDAEVDRFVDDLLSRMTLEEKKSDKRFYIPAVMML